MLQHNASYLVDYNKTIDKETRSKILKKSMTSQLTVINSKQEHLSAELSRIQSQKEINQENLAKLQAKTDKYIWLGKKFGLNFEDPEEAIN